VNNKLILAAVAVIAVIAVAGGGYYFLNANKSTTAPTSDEVSVPTQAPESETVTSPSAMSENEIAVEGGEFKFTPSEITVKKGEKVKITFKNTGSVQHDYVIEDLGISTKRVNPGQEDSVEFTPNESGEFKFLCSVGNHEELGMLGTLIVEE